jgi:CDP-L-myo-inositol myo-inositolphosphotransferase
MRFDSSEHRDTSQPPVGVGLVSVAPNARVPLPEPARDVPPRVAVILAAGQGSRLGGGAVTPKPLMKLLGLTLLERTILGLAAAGVEHFRVVIGAHAEVLRAWKDKARRLSHLSVELVHCADHELGNGHSLAAGSAGLSEPFILSMADHVFDPKLPQKLIGEAARAPDKLWLATDADIAGVFDLDDATKVVTDGESIRAIGKQLEDYDRVDAGVFYCPAWVATLAQERVAAGAHSVSQIMEGVIARGDMRSAAIEPLVWQDVDTPEMRSEAQRRLLSTVRKPTDGWVSRKMNRAVSLATTPLLIRLGISPNAVTTGVFVIGLIAAVLMASTSWTMLLVAGVLTQLASIWDGCDGEIARMTFRSSKFGAWYDTLTDNLRYVAMVVGCGVGLYRREGELLWLIGAGVFVVGAFYVVGRMSAYLVKTRSAGTHLVVTAKVNEAADRLGKHWLYGTILKLRPFIKQDVTALVAAVALCVNLPQVIAVGGVLAVVCIALMIEKVLPS